MKKENISEDENVTDESYVNSDDDQQTNIVNRDEIRYIRNNLVN